MTSNQFLPSRPGRAIGSRSASGPESGFYRRALFSLVLVSALLLAPAARAQQETRLWYFGQNAGLDFNVPPATPTAPAEITGNQMSTIEGTAVTSDRTTGALLFYTNGIGVWNRNNAQMAGTVTPLGGGNSSTQAGLTVPDPGNPNRYYLFTTPNSGTGPGEFNIVDMTQNGGLGDVTLSRQALPTIAGIAPAATVAEKLAATPDAAGTGYWVLFSEYLRPGSSSRYFAYHVSATGIDRVVVSGGGVSIRGLVSGAIDRARGELKFSPNGEWVAAAHEDTTITLHRFNRTTGTLSFAADLGQGQAYGVSFSPNSELLYVNNGWNESPGEVYQFDLSSGNAATMRASRTLIGTGANQLGGMQIAPDGRIYIARNGSTSLAAINCPDVRGTGAGFVLNTITFTGGRTSSWGLPNLILESVATPDYAGRDTAICISTSTRIGSTPLPGYRYSWSPSTGLSNPNIANPTFTGTTSQSYQLTITNAFDCEVTDAIRVTVNPLPTVTVPSAGPICIGESVNLGAVGSSGVVSYIWSPSTGLDNPNIASPSASPTATTTYRVIVANANGCRDTALTTVTVNPRPTAAAMASDNSICIGESTTLTASGGTAYLWQPSTGLDNPNIASPTASPTATTTYMAVVENSNGCTDTALVTIVVNQLPTVSLQSERAICPGEGVNLAASGSAGVVDYLWSPATGLDDPTIASPLASPAATTTYRVVVTNTNGCRDTGTVTVTVNALPVATAIASSDTICNGQAVTLTASGGTIYRWEPATAVATPDAAVTLATPGATTTYMAIVENANGCLDTALRTVVVVTPSITLSIPDTVGDPHTRGYRIPIRIGSPADLARCTPDTLTLTLLYNGSLFNPTGVSRGTMRSTVDGAGMRTLTITITDGLALDRPGTLVEIIGDVLLGNAVSTPLTIVSVTTAGQSLVTTVSNGSLGLLPYCLEGGPRLLNNPNGFGLKLVAPNPASDVIRVTVRSAEVGETWLEIFSSGGELVYSMVWDTGDDIPGATEEREIILPRSIPSGVYQLVLRTPSWRDVQTLIINK